MLFARGPPCASLCRGVTFREAFENRSLVRYLVEILDDVEAGETDPTQNDQSPHNLSPHATEYPRNRGACQVLRRSGGQSTFDV